MINRILYIFIFLFGGSVYATHIVGGALFYEKIASGSYIVTLKIYRDCKPGTLGLPNQVTIEVRGDQGSTFCPSKDFVLPRISMTQLDPIVDTCVVESDICVQEGIYQDTITNFSDYTGYHLYYQTCCRNSSVVNVVNPLGTGESFYAYIPPAVVYTPKTAVWFESFALADGTTSDNGSTSWSSNYTPGTGYNQVLNCRYEASNTNPSATWSSGSINIAAYTSGVELRMNLFSSGANLENTDSILVYYSLNGGADVLFQNNGSFGGTFTNGIQSSSSILIGNTVRIKVKTISNSNGEYYAFDNVGVFTKPTDSIHISGNSNPVFVNFPPIFVCVSETLLFDHSASDADGDSLVYSLYGPFDGRFVGQAGYAGYVPTFNNNDSILFQTVPFSGSYTGQNPLGVGSLSLNTQTGMLTVSPSSQGQFVVGVMVKEYRDGILIGYTVRDFQFNVIYCPPVADAIIDVTTNCDNRIANFSSQMTASTYYWNFGVSGTLADTSRIQSPTYTFPDTGTYNVMLITNYGTPCADTIIEAIRIKWITPNFSYSAVHCTGDVVTFTDLSTFSNNTSIVNWEWDFGDGTNAFSQNPTHTYTVAGTYNVILTIDDGNGCNESITIPITINLSPQVNVGANFSVCDNLTSIPLFATTQNATSIQWFTDGLGTIANNTLFSTSYAPHASDTFPNSILFYAVVSGNVLCNTDADSVVVTLLQAPNVSPDPDKTICFGELGATISTAAMNGTPPYTYLWNNGVTNDSQFVDTGTYTVQITDANACIVYDTVIVNEFNIEISINIFYDSVVCDYALPKNVFAVLTGATGVIWSGAGTYSPSTTDISVDYTPTPAEIAAGQFTLYAESTGNGACPVDYDTATVYISSYTHTKDSVIPGCDLYNGEATITVNGGYSPYTYTWSANAGGQTDSSATGLFTGMYYVSVTDLFGCLLVDSFNLDNGQPLLSIVSIRDVTCFGDSNGSATVIATNGYPWSTGYLYEWDANTGNQTGATATGLAAGTYQVSVTDSANCKATIPVTISQPADSVFPIIVTQTNLLCFGDSNGTATLSSSGGTGVNYTYQWSTNPVQTDSVGINLSAETYTVTVYDDSLCPSLIQVNITQPNIIQLLPSVVSDYHGQDISCYQASDGIAMVLATGGVGGYQYLWDDALSQTNDTVLNLSENIYHVTVTDTNNCSTDTLIALNDPDSIIIDMQILSDYGGQDIACYGDSNGIAGAIISGGTFAYTYLWNDVHTQTDSIANGLPAGTYQLIVEDANGCIDSANITLSEPPPLSLTTSSTPVSCYGYRDGTATVVPAGGTTPYLILWNLVPAQSTATAVNIPADTHEVSVFDTNGCRIDTFVVVTGPMAMFATSIADDTICPGNPKVLTVTGSGGDGTYTFHWNTGTLGPTLVVVPVQTTNYFVYATDGNNCLSDTDSVTVYVRKFVVDSLEMLAGNICLGQSTTIEAHYHGNLGPYTYLWSTGDTGTGPHVVTPLDTTLYTVTVTDACFNTVRRDILVLVYPIPELRAPNIPFAGCQPLHVVMVDSAFNPDIALYVWQISGGIPPPFAADTFDYVFESVGTYSVQLSMTSIYGCVAHFDTVQWIDVYPKPELTCAGNPLITDDENLTVNFTSSLHTTYSWDFGVDDIYTDVDSVSPTSYTYPDTGTYPVILIVSNTYGCLDTCEQEVVVKPKIKIKVPNVFTPNPNGSNGGGYNLNNLTDEVFFPFVKYIQDYHMMVFNRWGEMVFETYDINIGWDGYYKGVLCQQDVYAWKIIATFTDGKTRTLTGDITLLR